MTAIELIENLEYVMKYSIEQSKTEIEKDKIEHPHFDNSYVRGMVASKQSMLQLLDSYRKDILNEEKIKAETAASIEKWSAEEIIDREA